MGELTRRRVQERITALGLNPIEAARMAGFERTYFHDLLKGKKQSIRERNLPAAAHALQCDPEYLIGRQDQPRRDGKTAGWQPMPAHAGMPLSGIVEGDAWRRGDYALPDFGPLPIEPDPRFLADEQRVYLARGDHAAGLGILDTSLICIVTPDGLEIAGRRLHDGDIVLVRHSMPGGLSELTARVMEDRKDGVRLSAKPARGEGSQIELGEDVEIVGLILRSIRVFGLPA